jgi:Flp pilus assembly protein TadG
MTNLRNPLKLGKSGAVAAEFALTIPIVVLIIFGTIQMGIIFFANAGLQNALGDGARVATLWPTRSQQDIRDELMASRFGIDPQKMANPVITTGSTPAGQNFVEINVSYTTDLNFIFFTVPGITLDHSRRAYIP